MYALKQNQAVARHTPGIWIAECDRGSWWVRGMGGWFSISLIGREDSETHNSMANAKHIAACVNACQGIADPSVVPELATLLKDVQKITQEFIFQGALNKRIADALAKVGGRT